MHQIARRWAQAGVDVTWFTARPPGQASHEEIDGIHVIRSGGTLLLYLRAAARLAHTRNDYDAVIDCQNGIPFFAPLFAGRHLPVVQVVHHVHQDQFATRFPAPWRPSAGSWRAQRVYRSRAVAAVSPSTRAELRQRLGFQGSVFVVPSGTVPIPRRSGPATRTRPWWW